MNKNTFFRYKRGYFETASVSDIDLNNKQTTSVFTFIYCEDPTNVDSAIISKRVYRPIDAVIKKLYEQAGKGSNSLKPLKEEFLRTLILNRCCFDIEVFRINATDYNIKINEDKNIFMVLFKIDHFSDFCTKYNYDDRSILKYGIMNITCEILSTEYDSEVVEIGKDHIVVIFNHDVPFSEEAKSKLDNLLRHIQTSVYKYLDLSISCILGPQNLKLYEISRLYNETLNISSYRTFYGFGTIIHYDKISNHKEYIYPVETDKALIDALLLGKIEKVKKLYETIISGEFLNCQYSQFNSTLLRLAFSISSAVETIEMVQNLNIDYNFSTFIGKFNDLETLDEIRTHFYNMFDSISLKLEQKKIFKHDDLINRIIDIVNKNCTDVNLCLDSIADQVNMSPVYLGRLFKKTH